MSDVLNFINRRFRESFSWLTGNCYYFALILSDRFKGDIYYNVVDGHFITKIDGVYYDHTGVLTFQEKDLKYIISWKDFKDYDSLQYERIIRDCLL